jgi:uncharacterized membrane protein
LGEPDLGGAFIKKSCQATVAELAKPLINSFVAGLSAKRLDFVHVSPNAEISQLYDIVLISLLVFTSFILGFASLFLIHRQLLSRLKPLSGYLLIEASILTSSFAIYVGRDLRWNTWDVISNPGVLINVSDKIADPFGNPRAFNVTVLFFMLISVLYLAFWIFTYPAKHRS